MQKLINFLSSSYTAYQAVENAEKLLKENGFKKIEEREDWNISRGGKYYLTRGGSSILAFKVGEGNYFKLVCSHTDSPAIKLKDNPDKPSEKFLTLNAETYGGGIWYSFMDRPLKIAGRIVYKDGESLVSENIVSDFFVTIPSLAIHMNGGVNDGYKFNPQVDLLPLAGIGEGDFIKRLTDKNPLSYDLYAVNGEAPFISGVNGEFISSPRIDNLTSVYSSLEALIDSDGDGITLACAFDNEEVGSSTFQGAGSDFLTRAVTRIARALNLTEEETEKAVSKSFAISLDNAHSVHPNHPEKCDPTNRPYMSGGVVVKNHANKSYCTDAVSGALIKDIFTRAGVKYQTFYNRSDMRGGSTLGAISIRQISVLTADLGIAQLAMHSAMECFAAEDYKNLVNGLKAYYSASIDISEGKITIGENK